MWFGDLVTMSWFDDVWTKEVFANFMAAKFVNPSFPDLDHDLRFLMAHYPGADGVDRTEGANPIRQELDNLQMAGTLYGAIIYQKAPIVMPRSPKPSAASSPRPRTSPRACEARCYNRRMGCSGRRDEVPRAWSDSLMYPLPLSREQARESYDRVAGGPPALAETRGRALWIAEVGRRGQGRCAAGHITVLRPKTAGSPMTQKPHRNR